MNSKERVLFSQEAFNWGTPYGTEPIKQIYTYEGLLNMYLSHDISSEEFSGTTQCSGNTKYRLVQTTNRRSLAITII